MAFVIMLLGALFGAWFCADVFNEDTALTGALFGLVCGLLFAMLRTLRARVGKLEQALAEARQAIAAARAGATAQPPAPMAQAVPSPRVAAPPVAGAPVEAPTAAPPVAPARPVETALAAVAAEPAPVAAPVAHPAPPREPPPPTAIDRAFAAIRRWFTEGNVPVKIGVLVLFLGVAALLKYAADQNWLRVPMQFRLAGIAAAALAALGFAWRKRTSHRAFALSLQGGAIGVLILTVFAAYRLYALLPSPLAFALLVVIVAGAALLAVLQDSMALAVLAIVGGFLAPILVSTGHGNHVALFSYYAVLNAAVFAIAWIRPWRALNLVGFAFTFGVGTFWGALQYKPEFFASTEPFLLLFFAFYLLVPLLYGIKKQAAAGRPPMSLARAAGEGGTAREASGGVREAAAGRPPMSLARAAGEGGTAREASGGVREAAAGRQARGPRDIVDGTLVFGTPLIAFALQVALLERARLPLAFSAIGAAAIYTALAAFELRRWRLLVLGQSHALLALGFATIAVPLALSAQATSCTWAIEGAALVWLGLRQQRALPRFIGCGLQLFAGVAYVFDFRGADTTPLLLNGEFVGALLIALAGLASARLLERASAWRPVSALLFIWGTLWWLFAFANEIERGPVVGTQADWWLALFAATALFAAELFARTGWRDCRWPAALTFALAPLFIAFTTNAANGGPLEHWGLAAWSLWAVAALRTLADLLPRAPALARPLHFVFLWTLALLLGAEAGYAAERHFELAATWVALAGFTPLALLFWLALVRGAPSRYPLGADAEPLRHALLASLAGLMGLGWLLGLFQDGDPAPLTFVPVLNPLELAQLAYLALLLLWFRFGEREGGAVFGTELRARALAGAGVLLLTAMTLRGVHFLGGVPWNDALSRSPLAQAALSIVWTLAGIAAMLLGKQRRSRAVWFGGAVLMGVVLVKLLLVDRQFLHDLPAIVGVLVVGVLLVAVGYFAPVPPRVEAGAAASA